MALYAHSVAGMPEAGWELLSDHLSLVGEQAGIFADAFGAAGMARAMGLLHDTPAKHVCMFNRRALQGQCFHRPCFGTREFPAEFALLEEGAPLPAYDPPLVERDRDFGWMLHDIDFAHGNESRFFRAEMQDGVIEVPPLDADGVVG